MEGGKEGDEEKEKKEKEKEKGREKEGTVQVQDGRKKPSAVLKQDTEHDQ